MSTKTYKSKDLKTCFTVTLKGRVSAKVSQYKGAINAYKDVTPTDPSLTVRSYSCSSGKAMKLKMRQQWNEGTCSLNPTIGVGFPRQISVSVTPSCGKRKVANRSTTYTKTSKSTQYNSGSPAYFEKSVRVNMLCLTPDDRGDRLSGRRFRQLQS